MSCETDILKNVHLWLDECDEDFSIEQTEDSPDLYSFFEQLCAMRSEYRKGAKKNVESAAFIKENLNAFEESINKMNTLLQANELPKVDLQFKREFYLPVVELFERLLRIENNFDFCVPKGWFLRKKHLFLLLKL